MAKSKALRDYSIHGKSHSTGNLHPQKYNTNPQVSPLSNSPRAVRRRSKGTIKVVKSDS